MNNLNYESVEDQTLNEPESASLTEGAKPKNQLKFRLFEKWKGLKSFSKTKKGKVVIISSLLVIVLGIAGLAFILSSTQKPKEAVIVSETLASDRVYDNYDYIFNTSDNKLVASSIDNLKQLVLVSGEEKIMDYVISPDKKKIAYSISDKDYKSKIKAENVDLTKLRFDPVAFKIYELNLETGENKQVWSTDLIQLGATREQLYKKKQVVYPDSYVTGYNWWGEPFSYPVSYVEYVDDINAGYQISYLPWDLSRELKIKEVKLISYNSDSTVLSYNLGNKVYFYDSLEGTTVSSEFEEVNEGCWVYSGVWVGEFIKFTHSCYENGYEKIFRIESDKLVNITKYISLKPNSYTALLRPDYAIIFNYDYYSATPDKNINILDLKKFTNERVKDLAVEEFVTSVDSASGDYLTISKPEVKDDYSKRIYTLYRYNRSNNGLEQVMDLKLPNDIYGFSFAPEKNQFTYYRKYQASTESIIEYRILDTLNQQEKELLTIKVDNDSVLYFKPKLVWFNKE